jgi:hypothetical protein
MKEPFMSTGSPWEHKYKKRTENVSLFSHYMETPNERYEDCPCDYCGRAECRNSECEDYEENDPKILAIWGERKKILNMSLQDILNMLPEGVTPDQVKFSLTIDVGAMSVNGAKISFFYSKDFPDDPEGFKAATKTYKENLKLYKIEHAKYDQWVKDQEIKELEAKLANLKK